MQAKLRDIENVAEKPDELSQHESRIDSHFEDALENASKLFHSKVFRVKNKSFIYENRRRTYRKPVPTETDDVLCYAIEALQEFVKRKQVEPIEVMRSLLALALTSGSFDNKLAGDTGLLGKKVSSRVSHCACGSFKTCPHMKRPKTHLKRVRRG